MRTDHKYHALVMIGVICIFNVLSSACGTTKPIPKELDEPLRRDIAIDKYQEPNASVTALPVATDVPYEIPPYVPIEQLPLCLFNDAGVLAKSYPSGCRALSMPVGSENPIALPAITSSVQMTDSLHLTSMMKQ